jgi:hypothetical protein
MPKTEKKLKTNVNFRSISAVHKLVKYPKHSMVKKHWRNFLENKYQSKKQRCAGSKNG